jgi:DNA ligase-4
LPHLDRDRGAYGIKESKLAQRYIRVLGLAKGSADAQRLLNYRAPGTNHDLAGDFAAVACHVLKHLIRNAPSNLTVGDINRHLDNLATHAAKNNSGM